MDLLANRRGCGRYSLSDSRRTPLLSSLISRSNFLPLQRHLLRHFNARNIIISVGMIHTGANGIDLPDHPVSISSGHSMVTLNGVIQVTVSSEISETPCKFLTELSLFRCQKLVSLPDCLQASLSSSLGSCCSTPIDIRRSHLSSASSLGDTATMRLSWEWLG